MLSVRTREGLSLLNCFALIRVALKLLCFLGLKTYNCILKTFSNAR